ncbi:MAG TPA: SRPBCC domain-containing protein [Caulobacterales bacterium]|nr:SRPBCC domain-containing protein [Caulobacterales bacterium]
MSVQLEAKPSLVLTRRIKAPAAKVYRAWTDPEKIKLWWGPSDAADTILAEADVRVGGGFRIAFVDEMGDTHDVSGAYLDVVPNKRLVFDWAWISTPERVSLVTLTFDEEGAETLFTLRHEQFFDQLARDRHEWGWNGALDKLKAVTERIEPDRYERLNIKLAGLGDRFTMAERERIPDLWRRFMPMFGSVPNRVGERVYGVSMRADAACFAYVAAVEVASFENTPPELTQVTLDAPLYAVFSYRGGIAGMQQLVDRIGAEWRPELTAPRDAFLIERYLEDFDGAAVSSGIDILVPAAE